MSSYIGRFAPSPTGPLHFGSLLAAVASWVDARAASGQWLLRIEDVDTTRIQPGAIDHFFRALEHFGLNWDGEVVYQSRRTELYQHALSQLQQQHDIFWCNCTRSELARLGSAVYPGTCRTHLQSRPQAAARLRVPEPCHISFHDVVFGDLSEELAQTVGDFVLFRRDGLFAYQLAVVVDDALQGVTHIVRGADLLDNTARQIYLQQRLQLPTPAYCHLPLVTNPLGEKLSKQSGATALPFEQPGPYLWRVLALLGQQPPNELQFEDKGVVLAWAVRHWRLAAIPPTLKLNTNNNG